MWIGTVSGLHRYNPVTGAVALNVDAGADPAAGGPPHALGADVLFDIALNRLVGRNRTL